MKLYELIKQHAETDAKASRWSEVATTLNAPSQNVRITELRTTRWLMANFNGVLNATTGKTEADLVLGTLQASTNPRVIAALAAMGAGGIDLSDPQSQQLIAVLATSGKWPKTVTDKLQGAAFDQSSLAQIAGLGTVTPADCKAHWQAGQANEAGTLTFTDRRVLLSINDGPVNDSITLMVTPLTVISGVEISGARSMSIGGVAANLKGREKQLFDDLTSRVNQYLEGN